jgi:hypothetical protein
MTLLAIVDGGIGAVISTVIAVVAVIVGAASDKKEGK